MTALIPCIGADRAVEVCDSKWNASEEFGKRDAIDYVKLSGDLTVQPCGKACLACEGAPTPFVRKTTAPLYVRRDLQNVEAFTAWARAQGFDEVNDDLHVTVLYSKTPVDWDDMGEREGAIVVPAGGERAIKELGDEGAIVLTFESAALERRHDEMVDDGASHDYDEYRPHVTINLSGAIPADAEPYAGQLVFGPEIFEPIIETKGVEARSGFDPSQPRDPHGRWTDGESALVDLAEHDGRSLSIEEIEQIAADTAAELEFEPDRISVEDTRAAGKVRISGKEFTPAGVYSPSDKRITMFVDGLNGANVAEVEGTIAHEIQHAKTDAALSEAELEWDVFNERYPDRSADTPLSAVQEQEFPIYAKLRPFFTQAAREARENSGPEISPYAALHWESGGQHIVAGSHVGEPFILGAENETLSEITRELWIAVREGHPGTVKIPDEWRTFYRSMNEAYSDLFQSGRV